MTKKISNQSKYFHDLRSKMTVSNCVGGVKQFDCHCFRAWASETTEINKNFRFIIEKKTPFHMICIWMIRPIRLSDEIKSIWISIERKYIYFFRKDLSLIIEGFEKQWMAFHHDICDVEMKNQKINDWWWWWWIRSFSPNFQIDSCDEGRFKSILSQFFFSSNLLNGSSIELNQNFGFSIRQIINDFRFLPFAIYFIFISSIHMYMYYTIGLSFWNKFWISTF